MWMSSLNPRWTSWEGKRVWIIGASSGIGAELGRQLVARGALVAVSGRRREALERVASGREGPMIVLPMDARQADDWHRAEHELRQQWPRIDLVVMAAAVYQPMHSWELREESVRSMIDTNLTSVYLGLEAILPGLLAQGQGSVALVGSVAGYMGLPKAAVYGPTKAALINLAEVMYSELRDRGIGVYLVNPGFVSTRLTAENDFHMPALLSTEQACEYIIRGFGKGQFEIHFPKRFSVALQLMRFLPYRMKLALLRRVARNASGHAPQTHEPAK